MDFATAAKETSKFTKTENGAVALNTTGDKLLDFYSTVGALREADEVRITRLFADAYNVDPLMATKIAYYGRDIRGGLGERQTFRTLLKYMAYNHKEALIPNLDLVGFYGRYDDLYELIGTPVENEMWAVMKKQFEEDLENLNENKAVSLLAKWIKTADASSKNTRKLGILTAEKLGYSVYDFKRLVRALRKHIGVIESLMSQGKWDEIEYSAVPSRAMMLYREAFKRHDSERFNDFVDKAVNGEEKINSSTLYPYDLVEKVLYQNCKDSSIEAQWRQLPDYVNDDVNALVIADTSGSMYGRPLATSIGLALYFAQHNKGAYHNMWMTFSNKPKIQVVKGETLVQQIRSLDKSAWSMNTDLRAAFDLVLKIGIDNHVSQDEMPKSLIVISDMEIDDCGNRDWSFYDNMQNKFLQNGYNIPNIIFWNVNSRHDVFHADHNRKGVQLCSGQSAAVFKQIMNCVGMTPVEAMYKVINSDRYDPIKIAS